jgi:hypothetical protein
MPVVVVVVVEVVERVVLEELVNIEKNLREP